MSLKNFLIKFLAGTWNGFGFSAAPQTVAVVIKNKVPFSGNARILTEELIKSDRHRLIIFKCGSVEEIDKISGLEKVVFHTYLSLNSVIDVLTAGTVILGHSGRDAMLSRPKNGRLVINLWHGVAIKRIEHLMPPEKWSYKSAKRRFLMRRNSRLYDAMIASSEADRLVNSLAFGVGMEKIHVTGLPRFDYLDPGYDFPEDLKADIDQLDRRLAGRKMVLYAPTFREVGPSALTWLNPAVLIKLKDYLCARNMVLGIRPHPYDQKALASICDGVWIIDLRPDLLAEPAIALRAASALIVDYSSIWVDYLLLKRPIIGLMPDMAHYLESERGFIYDFPRLFPGAMLKDWHSVMEALNQLDDSGFQIPAVDQEKHAHADHLLLPPQELRFKSTQACMRIFFGDAYTQSVEATAKH